MVGHLYLCVDLPGVMMLWDINIFHDAQVSANDPAPVLKDLTFILKWNGHKVQVIDL